MNQRKVNYSYHFIAEFIFHCLIYRIFIMSNLTHSLVATMFNCSVEFCPERFSARKIYWLDWTQSLAPWLLAVALLPQIIYLLYYRTRYIAGISYISIIIRVLALVSLTGGHNTRFSWMGEFISFCSTTIIFLQILVFSNYLPRRNQLYLFLISFLIWIIGGGFLIYVIKKRRYLKTIGYLLLAAHMLPQVR